VICKYGWYPFIHLGGKRDCEGKVSCPRTQCRCPGHKPKLLNLETSALIMRPPNLTRGVHGVNNKEEHKVRVVRFNKKKLF